MRRNQLPPHPVVRLMFLLNTLNQSSLRKMTLHPVIMIFLSGPPFFFFSFQNSIVGTSIHVESIHPSFSIPAFFFFLLYFFYYCFVSTSGGPHQQEVSLLSSLFYSRKTGSWKMRDSMELTNWIVLRISAYNVCSNNMYFFLKKSMIAQLLFA